MTYQNVELQSIELFEELSDADLMVVVGGSGKDVGVNEAIGNLVNLGKLDGLINGKGTDQALVAVGNSLVALGGGK